MSCGFTSTTYDPCVDISLDLNSNTPTLVGCLDLFTRPEKLGSELKFFCQDCQERRDSLKQMSIRRLPSVLCLHIKRFEHSSIRKMSRKIDRHLQFPFSLDLSPYLSSSIVRKRFGNRIFSFEGDETDISTDFEVFAVVTHSGMLESGHYVTYLRLKNQWYKCDDAWINEVDEEVVRASQSYLIYYVQKVLSHRVSEDLSCLLVSPRGDTFVPIAGCCWTEFQDHELVELAKCEFGSLYGICDQISGAISALSQEGPQITGLWRLTLHLISGLSHICSKWSNWWICR